MKRTEFGRYMAKARVDRDMLLKDAADAIGVSSAFLSNVEFGRKRIPPEWFPKICELMKLTLPEAAEFKKAILRSSESIDVRPRNLPEREVLVAFASRKECLSEPEAETIIRLIENPIMEKANGAEKKE